MFNTARKIFPSTPACAAYTPLPGSNRPVGIQVRRRKTQRLAKMVTAHNRACEGIGAAQHLAGEIKITAADGVADTCAAHRLAIQRNRRKAVHLKTQLRTKVFQQHHVSAALVAEDEIRAHTDALDLPEVARQVADERFAGLLAECLVEHDLQQRLHAKRLDGAEFLRTRIDERREPVRRDDGVGMFVEGDDHRDGIVLARVGDGLPDDLLVAKMHAVEHADGQADLPTGGSKLSCGSEDFHLG